MEALYQYGISNYIMPFPDLVTTLFNVFVCKSRMLVNHNKKKAKSTLCDPSLCQLEEEVPVWCCLVFQLNA